jgi:hypothetical protein
MQKPLYLKEVLPKLIYYTTAIIPLKSDFSRDFFDNFFLSKNLDFNFILFIDFYTITFVLGVW